MLQETATSPEPAGPATEARRKVYPRRVAGRVRTIRWGISILLQALLFLGPWLRWNGRQAILADLPARKFHLFSLTFWPQETYFVLILLVFGALLLFASTAVAGRMWCGYACPQTLFTESFVLVENWIEGDRARRMRLDRGPWTAEKALRKFAKWSVWTVMAFWLGVTFVAYFYPSDELLTGLMLGTLQPVTVGFIAFFAAAAWFDFGYFREQMCHYACPYARFQGAMFDQDSLLVGYDRRRGEPRGKATDPRAGSCVDCTMCVQVCPMGIDIRNGLQLECIACAACADACDSVMDRLGRPRGLVRYSSLNALEGGRTRLVRARTVVYAGLLAALAGLFLALLAARPPVSLDVVRQVGQDLWSVTPDGRISNVYQVKLINKEGVPRTLRLSVSGLPEGELVAPVNPVAMEPESVQDLKVLVLHPARGVAPVSHVEFAVEDVADPSVRRVRQTSFLAPGTAGMEQR